VADLIAGAAELEGDSDDEAAGEEEGEEESEAGTLLGTGKDFSSFSDFFSLGTSEETETAPKAAPLVNEPLAFLPRPPLETPSDFGVLL
jgi:hypothetical protein